MNDNYNNIWSELRDNFSREIVGLLTFLIGGFFMVSLLASEGVPFLALYAGRTIAPWFALSLIIMGAVLMLSQRAGYWSVEAIIGAQLLLLSLMTGIYLWQNTAVNWVPQYDGSGGGHIGWSFGNLLLSSLGRVPALALMLFVGLLGLIALLRYTPLVYLVGAWQQEWPEIQTTISRGWREARLLLRSIWMSFREGQQRRRLASGYDEWETDEYLDPQLDEQPSSWRQPSLDYEDADESSDVVEESNGSGPEQSPAKQRRQRKTAEAVATAPKNPLKPKSKSKAPRGPKPLRSPDQLPPTEVLELDSGDYGNADDRELAQRIEQTLDDFNVPVRVVHIESGPTVTQFGVEPLFLERAGGQRRRIRVNAIVKLADDLALALEAPSVRMEAPVPGKPYVGIEVPNIDKIMVGLRGLVEAKEWRKDGGQLGLGLGRNTAGNPVIMDMARAPHMLIAGATGAGKSVCINTIIISLLMMHGPESLRFVMVDPKMVELPGYNGIPHLLGKVITDVDQVMGMLTWLLLQMDDRYRTFKDLGVRNIDAYNALARKNRKKDGPKPLPYIVMIVDELADLMMTAAEDIERQLCRLAQMARATGIHLILATQRPSTDVVTGLIKANFPTRIAFAVTSQIDSRVIMDTPGAERLLGRGDMLLMRSDSSKLQRVQGCFVSDPEISSVVNWWKEEAREVAEESGKPIQPVVPPWNSIMDRLDEDEELILDAIDLVRGLESISTSLLQRKLEIGYPKAARLMEELEGRKVVGPDQGGGRGRLVLLKDEDDGEEYDPDEEEYPVEEDIY